jgi:hypothetical protein
MHPFNDKNVILRPKSGLVFKLMPSLAVFYLGPTPVFYKKKGENNKKNGNRYLAWAYVEAANHAIRCCPKAQKFFQRKMAKNERALATKALANKLTKATYYIMRDQVAFDEDKSIVPIIR